MAVDVVLVHGGWHNSTCWHRVTDALSALGLSSHAVQLPFKGFAADVEAVQAALRDAGPSSVAVAHSYGGVVLSEAAASTTNVSRLVYVAAFLLEPSEQPVDYLTEQLAGSMSISGNDLSIDDPVKAAAVFYGDQDAASAAEWTSQLRAMPADPPLRQETPAWQTHLTTYVVCTNDRAIRVDAQRMMAARTQKVIELPTDHSPFLGQPFTVAGLIADCVTAGDH